jgi:hypothetical protein
MPASDTVNLITVNYPTNLTPADGNPVVDAYLAEEQAADPAAVLGEAV